MAQLAKSNMGKILTLLLLTCSVANWTEESELKLLAGSS